jgi:alanyl-tRNA synthetase
MTERLYYTDSSSLEFDASVVSCDVEAGRTLVTLDRTAFYPTSGGQPFDMGTLGDAAVIEVLDLEDGRIAHVVDRPIPPGQTVHGRIDVARRFDHMQQHTGQHILSAAFDRLHQARTVGFHLGALVSSLDLDKPLSPESLALAEAEANRIVWENRPVGIRTASEDEAAGLKLRKEPTRTGPLRIIEVEGFDRSACGGTHVARTGEVGVVAIKSWEKLRGGLRIEFVCGGRALGEFRRLRNTVAGCIRFLSVAPEELPASIERLQQDNKSQQRTLRGFQEQLAAHEASAMVTRGGRIGNTIVVVESPEGWDQAGLKALVAQAIATPGVVAALFTPNEPHAMVIGRSAGTPVDAAALLKDLLAKFGGKGGGKPDLAQGGGLSGTGEDIRAAALAALERLLGTP